MSEASNPVPQQQPERAPRVRRCLISLRVMNTQTGAISQRICGNPSLAAAAPICQHCFTMIDQYMTLCPHSYTTGFAALAAATAREATS